MDVKLPNSLHSVNLVDEIVHIRAAFHFEIVKQIEISCKIRVRLLNHRKEFRLKRVEEFENMFNFIIFYKSKYLAYFACFGLF